MKCKVTVELIVEGDFNNPIEAKEMIESELSFQEDIWEENIKDIDYTNVEHMRTTEQDASLELNEVKK